jgi:hypothetical protein
MTSCKDLVSNTNLYPRCGRKGWLVSQWVLNSIKNRYSPYYYFKHYSHGKVTWCYVPRDVAEVLLDARVSDIKKRENVTGALSR